MSWRVQGQPAVEMATKSRLNQTLAVTVAEPSSESVNKRQSQGGHWGARARSQREGGVIGWNHRDTEPQGNRIKISKSNPNLDPQTAGH